ncbi:MAG TPA: glutamate--tRNA ligase [Candidatus Babeliaceae bacterium]|nr:glutamate--tRNA ligase [Candidatus Babeliaceae bacterium]
MNNHQPRVRFAPSPTGNLHVGGLRTALFNWLYARHYGGKFLLRIEDTDIERSREEYTQAILEAFRWVHLDSDEPLLIQSQRAQEHKELAQRLLADGFAYKCYCSQEELQARLGSNAAEGAGYVMYDNKCRALEEKEFTIPYVIRFKRPLNRETVTFNDLIRGVISFDMSQLDDFIIVRSDGSPMYNFVVVADDAFMGITQVIRGEEHIANTPKQILLYEALGFPVPEFAHVPMILGSDGHKLSKRDAATSVLDYRNNGFLPDALCNYLVRLGWAHGNQEIFTRQELIHYFSLDEIGRKGAIFDIKKLEWLNGVYIRNSNPEDLLKQMQEINCSFLTDLAWTNEQVMLGIKLYQDRVKTLCELISELQELAAMPKVDEQIALEFHSPALVSAIKEIIIAIETLMAFKPDDLEVAIKRICINNGMKLSVIAPVLRMALTGKSSTPSIFQIITLLGRSTTLYRLRHLFKEIEQP